MFCTKYREICHKHGWTTTDNGSTVFVCKETEKGDTYSFHANRENFLDEVGAASDLLSSDVQSYAEGVYQKLKLCLTVSPHCLTRMVKVSDDRS